MIEAREGLAETAFYLRHEFLGEPHYVRLATNSISMSTTEAHAQRYMRLFAYLPAAFHRGIADALVKILPSHGGELRCGVTVKTFQQLPLAKAYLFDVSPRNLARIAGDALPQNFRNRLDRYRHGPGVFKVDYALSAPIPWKNEH